MEQIGLVVLRSEETMIIRVLEPPAGEDAERLERFLEHKGDCTLRDIRQRLRGDYADVCSDRFFVGEIGGRVVSQMWYTLPRALPDFGVFGHVYTEPEHRGKGAASALMAVLMDDFHAGPGQALFCSVGDRDAQRIYARHGFVPLRLERAPLGPQAYIRPEVAADFAALQSIVFAPGRPTRTRPADMADRARIDKLLHQADALRAMPRHPQRMHLAARYPDFVPIYQAVEDRLGVCVALEAEGGHVVGYAFALAAGSECERGAKTLDFLVHPAYADRTAQLISATVDAAVATGAMSVRCWLAAVDEARIAAVQAAGGVREHVFADYCVVDGVATDMLTYRLA
ncbi:MAG: GNAT family N-acetyltransferase [Armatimonadota bacterium]